MENSDFGPHPFGLTPASHHVRPETGSEAPTFPSQTEAGETDGGLPEEDLPIAEVLLRLAQHWKSRRGEESSQEGQNPLDIQAPVSPDVATMGIGNTNGKSFSTWRNPVARGEAGAAPSRAGRR